MLKVLKIEDGTEFGGQQLNSMLEGFKQYASVPDGTRDALLRSLLRQAVRRVQEYADKALVRTRLQLEAEPGQDRVVRLYMGGGEVVSVTRPGVGALDFEVLSRDKVKVPGRGAVVVEYVTEPVLEDVEVCTPTVYRYATALYDGETTETLNAILNEVL